MALAEAMQLKPAKSKVHQVLDRSFLLVERYDRLIDAQRHLQRLHQEDFCQALGVVPEMKYQNEGGPDLAQCFLWCAEQPDPVRRKSCNYSTT